VGIHETQLATAVCPIQKKGADSLNATAKNPAIQMRKRIGSTVYLINAYLKNDTAETMDAKIIRLIRNELKTPPEFAKMKVLQTGRLPKRSSS
jgi:hypothetical protein